jgi:coproporphyrinogen III oxidase
MNIQDVRTYLLGLQDSIIDTLQAEDGKPFVRDAWTRPSGGKLEGDGVSRLVEEGHLLERGGCNFSHVKGTSLPPSATAHRPEHPSRRSASRSCSTRATRMCPPCT